jgi:hypothetical protein
MYIARSDFPGGRESSRSVELDLAHTVAHIHILGVCRRGRHAWAGHRIHNLYSGERGCLWHTRCCSFILLSPILLPASLISCSLEVGGLSGPFKLRLPF